METQWSHLGLGFVGCLQECGQHHAELLLCGCGAEPSLLPGVDILSAKSSIFFGKKIVSLRISYFSGK